MSSTPITVLSLRVWSFSNRSFIIFKAGSIGTDVKRADTSEELRHSPGARMMCLTCSTKSWVLLIWWGDFPGKQPPGLPGRQHSSPGSQLSFPGRE